MTIQFTIACALFLTVICMHVTRKNYTAIALYAVQSFIIAILLAYTALSAGSRLLLAVALITLLVKTIIAPILFGRMIRKNKTFFSAQAHLDLPIVALIVAALTLLPHLSALAPLVAIAPSFATELYLTLSALCISIFFLINRRDVLSQALGILSIENCIVSYAVFSGLEQSAILQIGIVNDVCIWIIVVTMLASRVYKKFDTLDTNTMQQLTD